LTDSKNTKGVSYSLIPEFQVRVDISNKYLGSSCTFLETLKEDETFEIL